MKIILASPLAWVYIQSIEANNPEQDEMARKEKIYVVAKETNTIARASSSFLAAATFAASIASGSYYICTSEFQTLKKGDTISNIVDFL